MTTKSDEIRAIETRYKGYRFRSRLEARWAVFFDALEIPWEYEPEGYDLGTTGPPGDQIVYPWYLPDFRIDGAMFVEIKPRFSKPLSNGEEKRFIASGMVDAIVNLPRLSQVTQQRSMLLSGSPWVGEYDLFLFEGDDPWAHAERVIAWEFADCRKCDGLWLANDDYGATAIICRCDAEKWKTPIIHGERVMRAFQSARSARFGKDTS